MNKEVKKLWCDAMKSGKHKQGRGGLKRGDEFCCLGLLCELHRREDPDSRDWLGSTIEIINESYFSASFQLPVEVFKWAGLDEGNPAVGSCNAIQLNDDMKKTFTEIAELVEKHL